MNFEEAKSKLEKCGQLHVLKYYDELTEKERAELLKQIEETDFEVLKYCSQKDTLTKKGKIEPLASMQLDTIEKNREQYEAVGLDAIREGKVGAVLLAGGMGTRLGSDEPKGMYNIGITKEVYIFQRLIENMMEVVKRADAWIPLFIMTSDKNNDATIRFFNEHQFFGYDSEQVTFFKQEMAPAADYHGKVYMEAKNKISTSPNGNGGWFTSMNNCGVLEKIRKSGIEWLNVFADCAVGSKVVRKNAPDEKVGVVCLEDGKPSIVEYYELTEELMNAKDENGEPAYNFGVILNYLFREKDLEELLAKELPLHIVEKKIPYLDENANLVKPEEPNGYKFENLVLDMIHKLDSSLAFEVVREKEFAPIKNKTGIDSVESARELLKKNGIAL